jgi:hypothetical protein
MFPLPINTYIYAGLILLSVIGFSYGRYEHNKYVTFKAEVENAVKAQEAKVESIQKQHELVKKGIESEYTAKLDLLRQYYANGVRSPSSSSLSSIPDPTKPTSFIPTNNLLADCAQTTLMLTELQKWYLEVAGIK